jgi:HAD superfamily phosphatase (TIGR01668 family)
VGLLTPDLYHNSIAAIDLQALADQGVRTLLVDLDNTLVERNASEVPDSALTFARRVREVGMTACIISNNWHARVSAVADVLGFGLVSKALKPLPFAFLIAMRREGADRFRSVVVGDQLFTDILGGNMLGITTVLVSPLSDSDLPHTLLLRKFEARLLSGRSPIDRDPSL